MNPVTNAISAGFSRGWVEFKGSFRSPSELIGGYLMMPVVFIAATYFLGQEQMEDSTATAAGVMMAGGLTMQLAMLGFVTVAQVLATEREDGTLLRSRSVPYGMVGYAFGKTWHVLTMSVVALLLMIVPGLLLIDGFALNDVASALTLVWVCLLGLLALAPLGSAVGAVISNPKTATGFLSVLMIAVVMISGAFFPVDVMPGWVQAIALALPVYWIGLGLRAALLPSDYAALELAGSWQLPQVAGVLALWAVVGFIVAQWVLRRMARRESGSRVQHAREKAMQRVY